MPCRCLVAALSAVLIATSGATAHYPKGELERVNADMKGCLLDFTHNHRADHRLYSPALEDKRDVYVYLPPGYDGIKCYPVVIWLHGFAQDEKYFLRMAPEFDRAIVGGKVPPAIVVCPDGMTNNKPGLNSKASWFINSRLGRYEDFIVCDLWNFLNANFRLRPEREAHVLAGVSMGGFSAVNLAIKHSDQFQVVAGIMPLLDLRYADCHGDHFAPFDPDCQGEKHYHPLAKAGCFRPDCRARWLGHAAIVRRPF